MLNDLRHYSNLGTPQYFFQLISEIGRNDVIWTTSDIQNFFHNKIIDGKSVFDGCINFALSIRLLISKNAQIAIPETVKDYLNSKNQLSDKIIELFFLSLREEEQLYNIFSSKNLTYDVIYNTPQISCAAFPFKYSNIKQLLLDFGFIESHPIKEFSSFIINNRYRRLFDKFLLPEIKKRKIGIEELKAKLELQKLNGDEAELFVFNFEERRLEDKQEIQWVAQYIANQGYDIASFNSANDAKPNRFIEVKSYEGEIPYFFWSRNEYIQARFKKGHYWLYLVDRRQMKCINYQPIMIQDPYDKILSNETWDKKIEKYRITFIGKHQV